MIGSSEIFFIQPLRSIVNFIIQASAELFACQGFDNS